MRPSAILLHPFSYIELEKETKNNAHTQKHTKKKTQTNSRRIINLTG